MQTTKNAVRGRKEIFDRSKWLHKPITHGYNHTLVGRALIVTGFQFFAREISLATSQ